MNISKNLVSLLASIFSLMAQVTSAQNISPTMSSASQAKHTFSIQEKNFLLDGKPFQIRGGEMHPQRIPKEYWRHRIQMAKAMGLNTIAFYVMWNDIEKADGTFDFKTGERDIATFIKLCQAEGMWVMFRPGPYVCGEWDFGGLPADLLKKADLKIRTVKDADFMKRQTRYLEALAAVTKPFLIKNGGPIILTQIENEYGSWPNKEKEYPQWLKEFWEKQGFGPFNTADGTSNSHLSHTLPGVAIGLDPGEQSSHFENATRINPNVPVFCAELYPGWLRHWGEGNWKPTNKSDAVHFFMKNNIGFNFFPLHGGTNFAFNAGANDGSQFGGEYQADITSYDYGSPINEQGNPTPEYFQYREILSKYLNASLPEIPKPIPAMEIPKFTPKRIASLWDRLAKPFNSETAPYFESFDQNQGLAVYRITLPAGPAQPLTFEHLNDYGRFYLDGKFIHEFDRRLKAEKSILIPERKQPATLEILVEGMGHINFQTLMETDRKGLFGKVSLGDQELKNWKILTASLRHGSAIAKAPEIASPEKHEGSHFRTTFTINGSPKDTFLDMSKYQKGFVWVNGINLGRYWHVGPQHRLYCPGVWLKAGKNTIDIIDLYMTEPQEIRGCTERNYDAGNSDTKNKNNEW